MEQLQTNQSFLCFSVVAVWQCTSRRGDFYAPGLVPESEVSWTTGPQCLNWPTLHNDDFSFWPQMTRWSAPSPTQTLWSTPRWCPSTCPLLSPCWFTSASTSSWGWGGRGSHLVRAAGRFSQARSHHLWWNEKPFPIFSDVFLLLLLDHILMRFSLLKKKKKKEAAMRFLPYFI